MRLLLDTHVLLWWLADAPKLAGEARAAIADPANEICVSPASVWEAAIKRTLGKLRFDDVELVAALEAGGFREMPIAVEHALRAGQLPRHHDDPFDRMLVAQARAEGLTIVSRDEALKAYDAPILWA